MTGHRDPATGLWPYGHAAATAGARRSYDAL